MDIKELPERKRRLERDISEAIEALVSDFQNETGINVKDIYVNNMDVTAMGDSDSTFVHVAEVNLDI